jgi:hypothetical protein
MSTVQAQRLLHHLNRLVPREPGHYRHSDESHVRVCAMIARHHPALRKEALNQLTDLFGSGTAAAMYVRRYARAVVVKYLDAVRERLVAMAHDGNRDAIEFLADIEPSDREPDEQRLAAATEAYERLISPIEHTPGTYSVGTSAPMDAVVARILPVGHVKMALRAQIDRAHDIRSPLSNREDYLSAAFNLAMFLPDDDTTEFFEDAIALTTDSGRADDPLAGFGMPNADLRVNAGLLCSALARTDERRQTALGIGLSLLTQAQGSGRAVTHILRVLEAADIGPYLPLLASQPDTDLRAFAARVWAANPAGQPSLGVTLAQDDDPRVRQTLAAALSATPETPADADARLLLTESPYRSVRLALFPNEGS